MYIDKPATPLSNFPTLSAQPSSSPSPLPLSLSHLLMGHAGHVRSFARDLMKSRAADSPLSSRDSLSQPRSEHKRGVSFQQWTSIPFSKLVRGSVVSLPPHPSPPPADKRNSEHIYAAGTNPPLDARPLPPLPSPSISLASSAAPSVPPKSLHSAPPAVKIRDYAFAAKDARHTGRGDLTPKANLRLLREPTEWYGDDDESDDEPPPRATHGWYFTSTHARWREEDSDDDA